MRLNLGTILRERALTHPDDPAVRLNDLVVSYAELDRAARGIATGLHERGVAAGEAVGIMIPNVTEFTTAYFGILYAGCIVVPLNVLLSVPEVTYHLKDSEARLLVAHPFFSDSAREGASGAEVPIVWTNHWTNDDGGDCLPDLAESDPIEGLHPTLATDTAVILYTSGTTGKPKGAELTHSNLFMNCAVVVPTLVKTDHDSVLLAALPLFHTFGQTCIQNASIAGGACFTLLPRFTAEDAFTIMERDRVTVFAGVRAMYFALLHHESDREYDLSSLQFCMSGGAPLPVEVIKAFEKKYPVEILEGYGLSETSPVASFNMVGRPRNPGSIGYPVWGVEMCVVDDNDQQLADGEAGEICIRGHNVMKGYLRRPDATREALRGGWFHSGDIGIRDSGGSYRIVDRKKDMIIRGGFNV